MSKTNPQNRPRCIRKLYDLGEGNISVNFPKFVSELYAIANFYKTDSVPELISLLQGMCLAEGIRPDWSKLSMEENSLRQRIKRHEEEQYRQDMAKEERKQQLVREGSFEDRASTARKRLGDY